MILSGRDIQWYVQQGKLVIKPVEEVQFQQNGVDLILENVKTEREDEFRVQSSTFDQFNLGTTREWVELPDDLMAFVELRSTWAREGLFVPPTIVDAGFKGNLTLEIGCLKRFNIPSIPYGERFAHLIFAKLTSPSQPYNGKYQNQRGITPAIMDK